jgi:hypothetical protein
MRPLVSRRDGSAACIRPMALNTLMSNAFLHSSAEDSETFFTGSSEPWLIIRLSTRPKLWMAWWTAFSRLWSISLSHTHTHTIVFEVTFAYWGGTGLPCLLRGLRRGRNHIAIEFLRGRIACAKLGGVCGRAGRGDGWLLRGRFLGGC